MSKIDSAINQLIQEPEAKEAFDEQAAIIRVAQMVREWRKAAQITQTELAERVHTTQTAISRLESSDNESLPNLGTLIEIAHACDQRLLLGAEGIKLEFAEVEKNESSDHHDGNLVAL
ncbi:transcription regulator [Thiohalobacter thiocyanaticus]|uniref:Transcription regulator n=1 Tax=Thiohalobacter thiocyanaticus TaxID=585455 RepID=A0A1Z4VQ81_9GAMM|nr:helix-turn-helix transcriptional regulator [Thiohalobacter thiocyanaticus]BAZ93777.1 transcription regulator [Thiohalobacter thiocyanaticus]